MAASENQQLFTPLTQDELAILQQPHPSSASGPSRSYSPAPAAAQAPAPGPASLSTTTTAGAAAATTPFMQPQPQPQYGSQPPALAPARVGSPGSSNSPTSPLQNQNQQQPLGAMAALLPAEGEIRTFVGGDTLDEPVSVTILRDLKAIGAKLKRVCLPKGQSNVLRDYDLWGPLLLCLGLSITMSLSAPPEQTAHVFSGIFVLVWVGAAVVTLNTKLLGGTLSFFQSVCVLGYCVFPLFLASILCLFIAWMIVRGPVVLGAFLWSTYASLAFLTSVNLAGRRLLALYPVYLFYFALAWMILISKALV